MLSLVDSKKAFHGGSHSLGHLLTSLTSALIQISSLVVEAQKIFYFILIRSHAISATFRRQWLSEKSSHLTIRRFNSSFLLPHVKVPLGKALNLKLPTNLRYVCYECMRVVSASG
ncbi:hypothetical protein ILYODFUR_029759 [Ilyodon furcidens]|uniref:Uncharacterized protein n=1 Tax=Ilyodon furcidens TaxID=33524 RepID=A0ABV0V846_9TELE